MNSMQNAPQCRKFLYSPSRKRIVTLLCMCMLFWLATLQASAATPVSEHGRLSVKGTKLVDKKGKTFQIKGVSTHGLSWYPEYVSKKAFEDLRDKWGANTVRLAMYTAEYNGYCTGGSANRKNLKKQIDTGVKAATDLGMYVIIDWHILSDGNPNTYKKQSIAFFKEMAEKYKNHKNVIYEICNEPNGGTSWKQIRSYAQAVIKEIRAIDKNAVILVGTPTWSQDVDAAAKNPVKGYKNIMYTLHFYANTHRESYREKAAEAIQAGLPLLVSEFGICDASGNGGVNEAEANKWISFLDKHGIGYVAWNLSNKDESSALLKSSCKKKSGWTANDLSQSGKWLVKTFKGSLANGLTSGKKPESSASGSGSSKSVKASSKYCKASVKAVNSWKSGNRYYTQYKLTITNKSKYQISNWKVRVNFKYAIKKSQQWNGKYSYKSKYVTITPLSWNKRITPKGKVTEVGFIVSSANEKNKVTSVKLL